MNRHDNANAAIDNSRPSVSDLDGDNTYAVTARKHWFQKDKIRFDSKIVSNLFSELERDNWSVKSLLILENLQYVERLVNSVCHVWEHFIKLFCRYLWPNFNEDSTDIHVLSLALMLDMKRRENLPIWGIFDHLVSKQPLLVIHANSWTQTSFQSQKQSLRAFFGGL